MTGAGSTRRVAVWIAVLAFAATAWGGSPASGRASHPDGEVDWSFHSFIPLGFEPFQLNPSGRPLTLMATAQSPRFEGWHRVTRDKHRVIVDGTDHPVTAYPDTVDFRVTASTRSMRSLLLDKPTAISIADEPAALLLHLQFRLKIFHGLEAREVQPAAIRNLGVPPDVPYDERIYIVSFDLKDVSTEDRLVLEVFTPDGQRFCKFHLELL